ncbi:hypothetical protein GGU11DRAFT_750091 [Lentinula aff. detonsa]|uniref:Uncharacterized protein n=1 Tax=Lentinula aff. detonsa TaxID=2804958 RepID=A0AA38L1K5_9AGAR|nr:hypothetical protein GGU10DRAFT_381674 [Lentinula aff. detonsa]KAJ3792389.1 hypothetical protein GGU11DRAFT_750091 [Lentinula aff. detonsa]
MYTNNPSFHSLHSSSSSFHIFSPCTTNSDTSQRILRLGFPLKRSNTPDEHGFHPWEEYHSQKPYSIPFLHPSTLEYGRTDAFVDVTGIVSTFPRDMCLRWIFQDPDHGETRVLYGRDSELRWSEVLAGVRSGIVPARYDNKEKDGTGTTQHGPMNREWFIDMCSLFTVSADGRLLREGLEICQIWEDFEWAATVMLPTKKDVNLAVYTPERLVNDVRRESGVWHLDSHSRAYALLQHFNSIPPSVTSI